MYNMLLCKVPLSTMHGAQHAEMYTSGPCHKVVHQSVDYMQQEGTMSGYNQLDDTCHNPMSPSPPLEKSSQDIVCKV